MENVEKEPVETQMETVEIKNDELKDIKEQNMREKEVIKIETLLMILKNLLISNTEDNNILNKFTIKLNANEKEILLKILAYSPNVLNNIEETMKRIVIDSKIDSKDVPDIILCIKELYQLIYTFKTYKMDTKKRCELCATFVKLIIYILVEERIIKIDEDKKSEFLSTTNVLVDSAINLIGLSKMIKPTRCIKKLFSKK